MNAYEFNKIAGALLTAAIIGWTEPEVTAVDDLDGPFAVEASR